MMKVKMKSKTKTEEKRGEGGASVYFVYFAYGKGNTAHAIYSGGSLWVSVYSVYSVYSLTPHPLNCT